MSIWLTLGIGMAVVFIGLLCLICIIKAMSFLVRLFNGGASKGGGKLNPDSGNGNTLPVSAPANQMLAQLSPAEKGKLMAAIGATLAQYMGEDVRNIRIKSIKYCGGASGQSVEFSMDERRRLVAAISCAIAESMGQDVNAIRIHSIRRVA